MSERTEKEEKLIKKVQKKYPEFIDIVDKEGDVRALEEKLLTYAKHREKTQHAMDNDEELNRLKAEKSERESLYKPTLATIKEKSAYLHILIKDLKEANGEEYR